MKHRPAIQLRFRDPEQFSRIKENAAENDLSVNEYVLLAIEFAEKALAKVNGEPQEVHLMYAEEK